MNRKWLITGILFSLSVCVLGQVNLKLNKYSSNIPNFRDTAETALQIASFILSTVEFRDSLIAHRFKCSNISSSPCSTFLPGQQVYDSLIRYRDTTLDLTIKKLSWIRRLFDPHDNIGFSSEGHFVVTTRSWYLKSISASWYASIKYAAHLAHEYSHIRGYYHIRGQRYGEDVAETVGSIVSSIIKRRIRNGERIK